MSRKVQRAAAPRTVPTLGAVAAALILSTAAPSARADAGLDASTGDMAVLVLVAPGGAVVDPDAGEAADAPIRVLVDGVERPFGRLEIAPGEHTVRFLYRDGQAAEEKMLLRAGDVRSTAPMSCPYHPGQMLGGVAPPYDEPKSGGGGCCGSTHAARTAGLDLRALAAAAVAVVFTARRRRRR